MRALGLLLAAVVLAACASPPVTADLPPTVHQGGAEPPTAGRPGLGAMADSGHCWFLHDDAPGRARRRATSRHTRRASSSPAPQPQPSGRPTTTPAPAIAVPTSATTCRSDEHPNAT